MQLNLSSGTSMSSNSNGSSANSPSATTTQNGTRGPATGPRPPLPLAIQTVVIPPGSRLTDHQITYTDLPTGHHFVERQSDLLRVPEGQDVSIMKRVVKFVDDPDSLAIIVAVPTRRTGVMRPLLGISHRKLRYLFNVAINWTLTRDRLRFQDGAVAVYTSTSCLDGFDNTLALLPEDLTVVDLRSDGLVFDPPTVIFVEPQTFTCRLIVGALALFAGFLFAKLVMLSVALVLQATKTEVYAYMVYVTARELDAAFTTVRLILYSTARVVTKQVIRQALGIVAFFQEM